MFIAESPVLALTKKQSLKQKNEEAPLSPSSFLIGEESPSGKIKTDFTFLYWLAQEDGLEFAAKNHPTLPLSVTVPTDISASLSSVDFEWEPAFKFLLGYHFEKSSWDLNTRWTWYHSHKERTLSEDLSISGAGILPLWIPPQAAIAHFPVYSHAKGNLLLQVNNIDIELAYLGGVSPAFFLKLHGGLKGIGVKQTFRAKYTGGFTEGINHMLSSNAQARSQCVGLGPRIGFGSKWAFPHGFSLIAELAGAFALSEIVTKRKDQSIGTISGVAQNLNIRFKESFWVWRPLLEGKTGLQWEYLFSSKKRFLNLELAYEIQEYWDQNMFTRYSDAAIFYAAFNNRGNLTLQGISLTLALGY